jgi:NitT/TauT family transport system permease protein
VLPGPASVLAAAWRETLSGALPHNVGVTLLRVLAAFALSMLVGVVAGYAMGRSRGLDATLDPWLVVALNLPVLVVVVLVYIWVGLNDVAAVLAVAIAKIPTVIVTMREGTRALDPALDEVARVYQVSRLRRLRHIVVAQLAPYLAAAGRSGLSITWKIVLIVELLGRPDGVGFALNLAFQAFDVAAILAYGLVFAAIMLVVESVALQPLEQRARAWRGA